MQSRAARLARGWLVGSGALLIAAVAHTLGGGGFPGWLALLVGVVFAGGIGTALTSRRPSLPRLSATVAISQAAFHYLFVFLGGPTPAAASSGHVHGGSTAAISATSVHSHAIGDPAMITAHVAGAVLAIVLLRSAEAAAWSLIVETGRLIVARLRHAPTLPVARRAPRAPLVATALPDPLDRVLARSLSRRGPPDLTFA